MDYFQKNKTADIRKAIYCRCYDDPNGCPFGKSCRYYHPAQQSDLFKSKKVKNNQNNPSNIDQKFHYLHNFIECRFKTNDQKIEAILKQLQTLIYYYAKNINSSRILF